MSSDNTTLLETWNDPPAVLFGSLFPWIIAAVAIGLPFVLSNVRKSKIPHINAPAWWQSQGQKKEEWLRDGQSLLVAARKRFQDKPYKVLTEFGNVTVLPSNFTNIVKAASSETGLSFRAAIMTDFHANLPGFQSFSFIRHKAEIIQKVVRKQLTQQLKWKEDTLITHTLDIVARMSSKIFLGDELCRNEEWLDITKTFTVNAFRAVMKLNLVPSFLRYIAVYFQPDARQTRKSQADARRLIGGVISQRQKLIAQAREGGYKEPQFNDAITWAETESSGEPYDPIVFQLALSTVAIHTTSNLLTLTLLKLAESPEFIIPLREEIIDVLKTGGWSKTALFNMKLLDSAIKETQCLMPISLLSMRRIATEDVHLSEDIVIRKGEHSVVDAFSLWDPQTYENPERFDINRFKNFREQPGYENKAQLVSTGPEYNAFGHGTYACPGRFFATAELKIALCHLLLKYDWKLPEGATVKPRIEGDAITADPAARIVFRRRKEELNLEGLQS
ncbi:cytochrome p450 monooxygenase [Paramyrothecium foliicola]|nr:cytochrome p450 monooxygenase [Paramyrothecium foliicola]